MTGWRIYIWGQHHRRTCVHCQCDGEWCLIIATTNPDRFWIDRQRDSYRKLGVATALVREGI